LACLLLGACNFAAADPAGWLREINIASAPIQLRAEGIDHAPDFDEGFFKNRTSCVLFWAPWSDPCLEMLHRIETLRHMLYPFKIEIVLVIADNDPNRSRAFLQNSGLEAAALIFTGTRPPPSIAQLQAIPLLLLVDHAGRIRFRRTGLVDPAEIAAELYLQLAADPGQTVFSESD
jgi:thiol-disulfide isomerase/thioredoxin